MTDFAFIDSGVGGIPYMLELLKKQPDSSCIYVADSVNFPYGPKTHEQVVECIVPLVEKIINRFDPAVIVLACNTISVNALEVLRSKFEGAKFVGTVPAIKLASSVSKKRCIGLLATKATCENPYNQELKDNFASDCKLVCRPDGELVSFIEKNAFTATKEECLAAVKPAVEFFRRNDCDVIILGCTHFLNFTQVFKEACAPDISVVDSVDGVVRQMIKVRGALRPLRQAQGPHGPQGPREPSLYITSTQNEDEQKKYEFICSHFNISFGGNI